MRELNLFLVLLILGFFGNIVLHELGHFMAANYFELNPELHIFEQESSVASAAAAFSPSFYVSYDSPAMEISRIDAIIAFAGPFANLLFLLILCFIYFKSSAKRRSFWRLFFIALALPAAVSAFLNLAPIGYSDGSVIFEYLAKFK